MLYNVDRDWTSCTIAVMRFKRNNCNRRNQCKAHENDQYTMTLISEVQIDRTNADEIKMGD